MRSATIKRCSWVSVDDPLMLQYHDREWGVPVHDDCKHFEFLVLEGAQAGLSWTIVLKKREGYAKPRLPAPKLREHCVATVSIHSRLTGKWPDRLTQARLAVLMRTLVPKFFLTDFPASEA